MRWDGPTRFSKGWAPNPASGSPARAATGAAPRTSRAMVESGLLATVRGLAG